MVSKNSDHDRTIDKLDADFENDRIMAINTSEVIFCEEVAAAVRSISDMNEIANARIYATMGVASAKLSSSAEVQAITLLSVAETFRLKVQNRELTGNIDNHVNSSMISEIARTAEEEVSSCAQSALENLSAESKIAVNQINDNAKASITQIRIIYDTISTQILENATVAKDQLAEEKKIPRSIENVEVSAREAAAQIKERAGTSSEILNACVKNSIKYTNEAADKAIKRISSVVEKATMRIITARDDALARIQELFSAR